MATDEYELTREGWDVAAAEFPAGEPVDRQARFLLRYAVLAPSSHNAQPWRFAVDGAEVEVAPDESRWLPVADRDRRELYVSVGCAVENLRVAAEHFGLAPAVDHRADGSVAVTLHPDGGPSAEHPPGLFDAVTGRYTSHRAFADRPVPDALLERFRDAVLADDVTLRLLADGETKRSVAGLQAEGDRRLMADPEYRRELGHWVGRGTLGDSWLAARVGQLAVTHLDLGGREARKNSALVESAPVVAVLVTETDHPAARVRVGQAFERVALLAAAEGVAVHPMSQTLEVPELRDRLADLLDVAWGRPQHLFRLGYADEEPSHTPRWPVEAFLDDGAAGD